MNSSTRSFAASVNYTFPVLSLTAWTMLPGLAGRGRVWCSPRRLRAAEGALGHACLVRERRGHTKRESHTERRGSPYPKDRAGPAAAFLCFSVMACLSPVRLADVAVSGFRCRDGPRPERDTFTARAFEDQHDATRRIRVHLKRAGTSLSSSCTHTVHRVPPRVPWSSPAFRCRRSPAVRTCTSSSCQVFRAGSRKTQARPLIRKSTTETVDIRRTCPAPVSVLPAGSVEVRPVSPFLPVHASVVFAPLIQRHPVSRYTFLCSSQQGFRRLRANTSRPRLPSLLSPFPPLAPAGHVRPPRPPAPPARSCPSSPSTRSTHSV